MATQTKERTQVLTPYQVQRYSRHIIMPQVGSVGQRKMLNSKVLIVGAGGLGSPISIYLTLAGVGTIGIVEFDTVDVTNLQRQILHQNDDIGRPKAVSAMETLKAYNPDVNVQNHDGNTPLDLARRGDAAETVELLINRGAITSAQPKNRRVGVILGVIILLILGFLIFVAVRP